MKYLILAFVVLTCLLVSCGLGAKLVNSPTITVSVLRETKDWTPAKIKAMIRFVAREYDYDDDILIQLADDESDFLVNALGDGDKAACIFQIGPETGNGFVKDYKLRYTDRWNPVDQTIATIAALKDNKHCLGSPLHVKYNCKIKNI